MPVADCLPPSSLTLISDHIVATSLLAGHPPLNVFSFKDEFLHNCFKKMRCVWEGLRANQEIAKEATENVDVFQQNVVELTRCLRLLKGYTAEMDKYYFDEKGSSHHRKYVVCDIN